MRLIAVAALLAVSIAWTQSPRRPRKAPAPPHMASQWLSRLNLHDRIAQLVVMPCFGENPASASPDYEKFRRWVMNDHIGGLIILNRTVNGTVRNADPYTVAVFLNKMQRLSKLPLIVASDFERGASMRIAGTARYPHNMAYGAARAFDLVSAQAAETARTARALGVHWVFAPVADVNNNPDNPVINLRSYGEDPEVVSKFVSAYVVGARTATSAPVLVTVKHFPGHGDTSVDTHLGLAKLDASRERLERMEFAPFRAAIAQGVDAVMTAHMAVHAVEPEPIPATVSAKVLTGVLRDELGFEGIISTDAMDMQGLANQFSVGEASVRAIEAGADLLLMPRDAEEAIRVVTNAVAAGRISRKRIDESAIKILSAKVRLGLGRNRFTDVEAMNDIIDNAAAEAAAQDAADRGLTLVRNQGSVLPLANPSRACVFSLLDSRYSQQGRQLQIELRRRAAGSRLAVYDPSTSETELKDALTRSAECDAVVVANWTPAAVPLAAPLAAFLKALLDGPRPVVLVAFGNPYLARTYPKAAAYVAAFSTAIPSEIAVAKALAGEIGISGRLPVSIPGYAALGDGIDVAARK